MALMKKLLKNAKVSEENSDNVPEHLRNYGNKGHGGGDDESNWLVSYADMMTLLCGFFIMLFSMAKLDETQYETVKESVSKQFGGEYKSATQELAKFATQVLQEAGVESETLVKVEPTGISMVFESTVFFQTLSADVTPEGRAILDKLIGAVKTRQVAEAKEYKIVVEGHTDARPILGGTFPSNWELSGARASRVVRLFLDHGFTPDRLTAIGYADTRPVLPSRNPAGQWDEKALGKNRRVVLRIINPRVDSIPYPDSALPASSKIAGPPAPEPEAPQPQGETRAPASNPETPPPSNSESQAPAAAPEVPGSWPADATPDSAT